MNCIKLLPFVASFAISSSLFAQVTNQLPNPSMEGSAVKDGLPAHWQKFALGVPATFSIDEQSKHSGAQSIHLDAKETARSYVWSDKIPVAPGEKIKASCWMKVQNIEPAKQGPAVRIIAQFTDPEGRMESVKLVGDANPKKTDWQLVKGEIEVPENALAMRLQIGFTYCYGDAWLDDATITPVQALVARADVGEMMNVSSGAIPVTIINRSGAKIPVRIVTSLSRAKVKNAKADEVATDVVLDGSPTQKINVPAKITRRDVESLEVSLFKKGENKALFTQKMETLVPPELELTPTIPTHWCIEDGAPNIEGDVFLAIPQSEITNAKIKIDLRGLREESKATVSIDHPVYGMNHYKMNLPQMPEGTYRMLAEVDRPNQEAVKNQQPFTVTERKFAKITLNEAGYPVYNGRAIFPLGIFNGSHFQDMGEAGFTVAHGYNSFNASPVGPSLDNTTKKFMDEANMNGMKTLFLIPRPMAEKGDWEGFRRRIRMFKNHPGLLAWDEEEEVARGNVKPEIQDLMCKIIREEDPNHPIMIGDSRDVISRMAKDRSNFFRNDLMDLGMWWWYPFPLGGKDDDVLLGVEKTAATEIKPPGFLTTYQGPHPLWVGIQSYKHDGQADARFPTPLEYRAQAYIAIIYGGKGLMYYGGAVHNGMLAWDEKNKRPFMKEAHWDYVQKLARELHDLSDVFMAPDAPAPTLSANADEIAVRMKNSPRGLVLIAANRNNKPLDVTFSSSQIKPGTVRIPTETRSVSASSGSFKDHFDAYQVHVYELP